MKHYIIVKWNKERLHLPAQTRNGQEGRALEDLYQGIAALFQQSLELEGVHEVSFHPSVIDMPNRYDLMICVEMDREALERFDASGIHARWKAEYGRYLEAKAIFDCD